MKHKEDIRLLPIASFVIFLGVLTFVSIKSTSPGSSEQALATAFSAIVGVALSLKYSWWESVQTRGHVLMIGLSLSLLMAWCGYVTQMAKNNIHTSK